MNQDVKPDIAEVIGKYLELRPTGRELSGLCPFHADRNPSLRVNQEKQAWYCDACGEGGDVIAFVQKYEQVNFKTACRLLNLTDYQPKPQHHKAQAAQISAWARDTSRKICTALRDIGDEIRVCSVARKEPGVDKKLWSEREASLIRQWAILEDLDDDLNDPKLVLELWARREDIESVVDFVVEVAE